MSKNTKKYNLFSILTIINTVAIIILFVFCFIEFKNIFEKNLSTQHVDTQQNQRISCLEDGDKNNQSCQNTESIKK